MAAGEPLSFRQEDVPHRGAAMECRINAEDPAADFRPSPGLVTRWQTPGGPGVRLDSHVTAGYRIPPNYDSLAAKLLVWQPTRGGDGVYAPCPGRVRGRGRAYHHPALREIFNHPAFIAGKVDTTFIERTWQKG